MFARRDLPQAPAVGADLEYLPTRAGRHSEEHLLGVVMQVDLANVLAALGAKNRSHLAHRMNRSQCCDLVVVACPLDPRVALVVDRQAELAVLAF